MAKDETHVRTLKVVALQTQMMTGSSSFGSWLYIIIHKRNWSVISTNYSNTLFLFSDFALPSHDVMKAAVEGLLSRLLHERGKEFIVKIGGIAEGKDYFKVRKYVKFLLFIYVAFHAKPACGSKTKWIAIIN